MLSAAAELEIEAAEHKRLGMEWHFGRRSSLAAALRAVAARLDEEERQAKARSSAEREAAGRPSHAKLGLIARLDADLSPPDNPRTAPTPPDARCEKCRGRGAVSHGLSGGGVSLRPCRACGGTGEPAAPVPREGQEGAKPACAGCAKVARHPSVTATVCATCGGYGFTTTDRDEECQSCGGSGDTREGRAGAS